jgi:hypothetical protein
MDRRGVDFFISYTRADVSWAEWIAWVLEEAGYSTKIQAWDFVPGANFILEMQHALTEASRTIAVLSPDYLKSHFAAPEWAAAFANDPEGWRRSLVPVRVRHCPVKGLLKGIIYVDLVGKDEDDAEQALLKAVSGGRNKPASRPAFPGPSLHAQPQERPQFPGNVRPGSVARESAQEPQPYMPELRCPASDLDKRRFMQSAFEAIVHRFEEALAELASRHAGVDYEFKAITQTKYVAEVFVDGQSRARCKFWLADKMLGDGIAYSEVDIRWGEDNSYNEMLTLARDELALHAIIGTFGGKEAEGLNLERLTSASAAEYLWRRFAFRLT